MMPENGGIALGIGAMALALFILLPALIVGMMFLLLFVYAIVQIFAHDASEAAAIVVLVGLVAIVTVLLLGLTGATALIGRSLTPRKRRIEA
jgi:hypothetical protein